MTKFYLAGKLGPLALQLISATPYPCGGFTRLGALKRKFEASAWHLFKGVGFVGLKRVWQKSDKPYATAFTDFCESNCQRNWHFFKCQFAFTSDPTKFVGSLVKAKPEGVLCLVDVPTTGAFENP